MSKVIIRTNATSDPSNTWVISNETDIYSRFNKLGIGKTPTVALDVSGNFRATGTVQSDSLIPNDRWFSLDGTKNFYLGGNIGIGKSNPSSAIDVSGSARISAPVVIRGDVDICNNVTLDLTGQTSHTHTGNVVAHTVTIPNSQRIRDDLPFDLSFDGDVNIIKFNSSFTRLYVGGVFTHLTITARETGISATYDRKYFCEIDCVTGIPTQNTSTNAEVSALIFDSVDDVYVGGSFTTVGDAELTAARIAKWSPATSTWTNIGALGSACTALAIDNLGRVYIGGNFTSITPAGGSVITSGVNRVARYVPATGLESISSPLSTAGSSPFISAMTIYNNILYVGGNFDSTISAVNRDQIVSYNIGGSQWVHMERGFPGSTRVYAITVDPNANLIYVGGTFRNAVNSTGTAVTNTDRIAIWNPTATPFWSGFSGTALNNSIRAISVDPSGRIYVGGDFTQTINSVSRNRIAIRNTNNTAWDGVDASVGASSIQTIAHDSSNNLLIGGAITVLSERYNNIIDLSIGRFAHYNITTREWTSRLLLNTAYENDTAGKLSVSTINSTSSSARVAFGKSASSSYTNSSMPVDICGGINILGTVVSINNPYANILRVFDTNTNDSNTSSPNSYTSFVYIDLSGRIVGNTTQGNQGIFNNGAQPEGLLPIAESGVRFTKVYNTTHNTFGIDISGRIYSCGSNEEAICGLGFASGTETTLQRAFLFDDTATDISNTRFSKMIISDNIRMVTVYALTVSGDLYACGANTNGQLADGGTTNTSSKTNKYPNLVTFNNSRLRGIVRDAVSCGRFYTETINYYRTAVAVLDVSGFVWCAGTGVYGQMGNGATGSTYSTLSRVQTSAGVFLQDISSIYSYGTAFYTGFMALSTNGSLYVWGASSDSQLLIGGNTVGDVPYATQINNQFTGEAVSRVWTTQWQHADIFVETASGLIYGTGRGYGLGINTISNAGWKLISHFNTTTKRVVQMFTDGGAGANPIDPTQGTSTFAITRDVNTDRYTLWGTGYNDTVGRLGIGNTTDQRTWRKVPLPSHIVRSIRRIICNSNGVNTTTVILLNTGHLLFAGRRIPLHNDTTVYSTFTPLAYSTMLSQEPN